MQQYSTVGEVMVHACVVRNFDIHPMYQYIHRRKLYLAYEYPHLYTCTCISPKMTAKDASTVHTCTCSKSNPKRWSQTPGELLAIDGRTSSVVLIIWINITQSSASVVETPLNFTTGE